ncbi:hypothetical protein LT493_05385 [Streptomyces tricolor]|nr:hypothetical protein [Streptomyces tricolor]
MLLRTGDLAHAPLYGLVRAAQAENPGRFLLVDSDGSAAPGPALAVALAAGEPEVAVRTARCGCRGWPGAKPGGPARLGPRRHRPGSPAAPAASAP